jgi:5-methylcytosine-specific restriction endonuclease McrA
MAIKKRKPVTREMRDKVHKKTKGRCWYCGDQVFSKNEGQSHFKHRNLDHVIPHHRGGPTNVENLVVSCFDCNMSKRIRDLEEFRQEIGESWASSFELAVDDLRRLRKTGTIFCPGLDTALLDIAAFCRRANFLFYGETIVLDDVYDYQI